MPGMRAQISLLNLGNSQFSTFGKECEGQWGVCPWYVQIVLEPSSSWTNLLETVGEITVSLVGLQNDA
jgi:hypothetical protein